MDKAQAEANRQRQALLKEELDRMIKMQEDRKRMEAEEMMEYAKKEQVCGWGNQSLFRYLCSRVQQGIVGRKIVLLLTSLLAVSACVLPPPCSFATVLQDKPATAGAAGGRCKH